jgi:hypothetical protein
MQKTLISTLGAAILALLGATTNIIISLIK